MTFIDIRPDKLLKKKNIDVDTYPKQLRSMRKINDLDLHIYLLA